MSSRACPALVVALISLASCHLVARYDPAAGDGGGPDQASTADTRGGDVRQGGPAEAGGPDGPRGSGLTCASLLATDPSLPSGVYTLDPDGPGGQAPFDAYCEMAADGGGWTLVIKADGTRPTFHFDGVLWSNMDTLNPERPDLDLTEAKLASFHTMPFSELRLGMIDGGSTRWIVVAATGTSLYDVFKSVPGGSSRGTDATIVRTAAGRAAWLSLLAAPSLQPTCDLEGLNNDDGYGSRVRIGIVANNEPDCGNTDSWLGFGGMEDWCATPIVATVGNGHCQWEINSKVDTATFGYVMIR